MIAYRIVLYLVRIFLGGSMYYMLETVVRGYSHWTMFILGGVCFLGCGVINDIAGDSITIWEKMVWCMIVITILEFLTGVIVNVKLGWYIWDYSGMPMQVMGQICVPYMLLWYAVSGVAIWINKMCDKVAG